MRSSIKTITNVSYDNRAVDLTEEGLSYRINSDHISYISTAYTDIDSRATHYRTLGDGVTTDYSRGQTITVTMASDTSFAAGHDYMGVMTIYQRQAGDMSEETSPGQYNVYMGAGRVQDDSSTTTEVYIDKDIGFIKTPVTRNGVLVGGCVLRLNDRDLLISAYNPTTGKATVECAKINGVTSTTRATTAGEAYKLITNYLVCDAFVFYYRTTPTLSITCELTTDGITAVGTYSQAEGTEIQSWRMWATYAKTRYLAPHQTIRHEEHFNTDIEDIFPMLASNGYDPDDPDYPAKVVIYLEVTTQDGVTVQTNQVLEFSALNPLTVTRSLGVGLSFTGIPDETDYAAFAFREQAYTNNPTSDSEFFGCKYVGSSIRGEGLSLSEEGYVTTYRYIVCAVDENGNIYYGRSNWYTVPARRWSIEHIHKIGYNQYHVDGNRYEFMVDINPSQIETVLGGTAYSTEGRYPKYIHGSDKYDTGSFTAILGSIIYPEASVWNIERWSEYISQKGLFLLKTDYGDVKIVAITGNPTRQYGTSLEEMGITRVTYTWVEMADIDEVVVI